MHFLKRPYIWMKVPNILTKLNYICLQITEWCQVIGRLIFISLFPQNSPLSSGFFAENDLQLKASYASSTPCITGSRAVQTTLSTARGVYLTCDIFKTLQHTATHSSSMSSIYPRIMPNMTYSTRCNTLQHAATHYNTIQHTAPLCTTLQHSATLCNTDGIHNMWHIQKTATHYSTMQPPTPHCNTLQHTAKNSNTLDNGIHAYKYDLPMHYAQRDVC